jgi:uncharacterized membrane protein YtjA (UPF0391 family)
LIVLADRLVKAPVNKFLITIGYTFWRYSMLRWAIIFLVVAIIAAIFGFAGIAGAAAGIAKILFWLFLILFVVSLIFGRRRVL